MSDGRLKVLIFGGYGTFGGRLAQLLAGEARLELVIAGRSRAKAEDFCAGIAGAATLTPAVFDREGEVEARLAEIAPDVVVDASGPFQAYGDPYRVVRACIAGGAAYLDLADGSDFVAGIAAFDADARAAGVAVLSGLSTCPVLTSAVVDRLGEGIIVEDVSAGIAPSPHVRLGLSVIRAISGYAGKPLRLLKDGAWTRGWGLTGTRRFTIRPPGVAPLPSIRFALVDVPDLTLLPAARPELRSMWLGAGSRPESLQSVLTGLAWLVRLGILPTIGPLASLFHWAGERLRWGAHRGGMFVEVRGRLADGRRATRSWHMLAEGDDGPFVPSMACASVIRRMLEGRGPPPGARPGTADVTLDDYEAMFALRAIRTGVRETIEGEAPGPLYRRHLGSAWDALPAPIREMHDIGPGLVAEGRAEVARGKGLLAQIAAALIGAPGEGADVPVSVAFTPTSDGEVWRRSFARKVMQSVQADGAGRWESLVRERFGPVTVGLACVLDDERLRILVRRWSLFGVVLPMALAPYGEAHESAEDGVFHFHVEMRHPWTGLIVRYRGRLTPVAHPIAKAGGAVMLASGEAA